MARKQAHLEMKGGKAPRQRVWEAIRRQREAFTQPSIAEAVRGLESIIKDYFQCLLNGRYIEVISEEAVGPGIAKRRTYRLVRDNGVEAPRLTRSGEEVTQGAGTEAMWGTMHRLFEKHDFNWSELAAFASTEKAPISQDTAKKYVRFLHQAGYLRCTVPEKLGRNAQQARFRLISTMYTGPRAPMIQRAHQVYDPNTNRVMWTEPKGVEHE